ncbi:transporter substrate-binding domain-containing protein [Sphaerochaeta sp. PS]|uniref:transporter substrate-binding domain-containing protein n=1 Tax=Sphaerochaeta sp. PS TaxID=3076336 RepID=UPI0028A57BAD|nr:transporter substrate-binding domain-containing protein [Sphaerochaeta sp. PS]MDT4763375.1 transporter substrate-binding domain-containing protein [Sphaerochaeta sp. PS]
MKKLIVLVILVVSMIPLFSAGSKESSTLPTYVFAANCAWPPLEFVDEKGNIVGFEIDLVNEIAKVQNVKITIQNVAWDGIFAGLSNGAYDAVASGVSVTEERKKTMGFSTPIMTITQAIISPLATKGLTSTATLKGKKVGVQLGTTGHIFLDAYLVANPGMKTAIMAYDEIGFAIEDMLNGNLDAVVTDSVIASDFVLSNPNYASKLQVSGSASDLGDPEPIAIAMLKSNTALQTLVNDGLAKIVASGKMVELQKKWNIL